MRPATMLRALALLAGTGLPIKIKPSHVHCVSCHCPIPPGKAGRRCVECRSMDDEAHQRETALRAEFERVLEGQTKR